MANTLRINGNTFGSTDIFGLDSISLTVKQDEENKVVGVSLSQEIVLTGEAYKYIEQEFFTNCESIEKIIPAMLNTDICGGLDIPLFITGETVSVDP